MANNLGQQIKDSTIDAALLTGPGEDLIPKLLAQMAKVKGLSTIFGEYKGPKTEQQRWADYDRLDWSVIQLPAINIYESGSGDKESDQAFYNGSLTVKIYWPPSFRRSDFRRVDVAMKSALENFFSSQYAFSMLDEHVSIERPEKVFGLNEIGRRLTWTPNVEAVIGNDLAPVTLLTVQYKLDLRAWYRALEHQGRTKDNPFENTLEDLAEIGGFDDTKESGYEGVNNQREIEIFIPEKIPVNNGA